MAKQYRCEDCGDSMDRPRDKSYPICDWCYSEQEEYLKELERSK